MYKILNLNQDQLNYLEFKIKNDLPFLVSNIDMKIHHNSLRVKINELSPFNVNFDTVNQVYYVANKCDYYDSTLIATIMGYYLDVLHKGESDYYYKKAGFQPA